MSSSGLKSDLLPAGFDVAWTRRNRLQAGGVERVNRATCVVAGLALLTGLVSCGEPEVEDREPPAERPETIVDCVPSSGPPPLTVRLRSRAGSEGRTFVRYRWDFEGDGEFDTDNAVPYDTALTFEESGSYSPALELTDDQGTTRVETCEIRVDRGARVVTVDSGATVLVREKSLPVAPSGPPINLALNVPITTEASSAHALFGPERGVDGNPNTSWFTSSGDARNRGGAPFFEVSFPLNVQVLGIRLRGNREWPSGFDFKRGELKLFDEGGEVIYSKKVSLPSPDRDLDLELSEARVRVVRFTALDDEGNSPGFGELEILGPEFAWVEIETTIEESARVSLQIEDQAGAVVRTLVKGAARDSGSHTDYWDGRNDQNEPVGQGVYYAVLTYEADGKTFRVDPRSRTGGVRYNPEREQLPQVFHPFEDEPLAITFTIPPDRGASEVLAFIGLYETDQRFLTLLDRMPFGAGVHTLHWEGLDAEGRFAEPPAGDAFLVGLFAYTLPDNAIYVAGAPVISSLTVDPNYFDPATPTFLDRSGRVAVVSFDLDKPADVELSITSLETGRTLRVIRRRGLLPGSSRTIEWDGRADDGVYVDKGDYRLAIRATDEYGNRSLVRGTLVRVFY